MKRRLYSPLMLVFFFILHVENSIHSDCSQDQAFWRASYNAFHFRPVAESDLNKIMENESQLKALWSESVQRRNTSLMERMLQKRPGLLNSPIDKTGNDPLENAIKAGKPEEVNFFLEHGSQAGDTAMKSAEFHAAQAKKELEALKKKFQNQRSSYKLNPQLADLKKEIQKKELLLNQKQQIAKTLAIAHKKFIREYNKKRAIKSGSYRYFPPEKPEPSQCVEEGKISDSY